MNTSIYTAGVILMLFGGQGLAQIAIDNHGCFALCVAMFSVGLAMCITEFIK